MYQKTNKGKFMEVHNRLSPSKLQTTMALLSRFKSEKMSLFKNEDWSIEKLRRPFLLWLTNLDKKKAN